VSGEEIIPRLMSSKQHLVLSDIHENSSSILRFITRAETEFPKGFDIWLLGDLFGHPDQSIGDSSFNEQFLSTIQQLEKYHPKGVFGNWEYWLNDEAGDSAASRAQHLQALKERRAFLIRQRNALFKLLSDSEVITLPAEDPEFTLFHGCSFACHETTEYQVAPCECYLYPKDLNIVTKQLFGDSGNLPTRHFLFGHTHLPGYFVYAETTGIALWMQFTPSLTDRIIRYDNGIQRFGINPGSAGVATQRILRTAVLLDTDEKTFRFITDEESD
jgi:predicted phosphodiesterase